MGWVNTVLCPALDRVCRSSICQPLRPPAAAPIPDLMQVFCAAVLADQEERVEEAEDLFEREFQRIRLEQLRVQLAWAMDKAAVSDV